MPGRVKRVQKRGERATLKACPMRFCWRHGKAAGLWDYPLRVRQRNPAPPGSIRENQAMKETYPLRLPRSLKQAVERLSRQDGTSINQFVATAVAEKVAALETARFFEDRKARADFQAFEK